MNKPVIFLKRLLFALSLCCFAFPLAAESPFAFHEASPTSLALTENGKPVLVYNHGMMLKDGVPEGLRRSSYFHPVYAPDGTVVTDDFPRDHYHHRGISWMWPVVVIGGETYDLWHIRGIRQKFVRWTARETGAGSARLGVENGWFTERGKVLKEIVDVVVHPAESNRRSLDFTLTLNALEKPIEIRGTPDLETGDSQQQKGYGGFIMRFAPREETVIRTDKGKQDEDSLMVPHAWAELDALMQGRRAGARIEIDSSHRGFPNGWILRHYGLLGVNFPGLKAYALQPGRPLILKYRVTVFAN